MFELILALILLVGARAICTHEQMQAYAALSFKGKLVMAAVSAELGSLYMLEDSPYKRQLFSDGLASIESLIGMTFDFDEFMNTCDNPEVFQARLNMMNNAQNGEFYRGDMRLRSYFVNNDNPFNVTIKSEFDEQMSVLFVDNVVTFVINTLDQGRDLHLTYGPLFNTTAIFQYMDLLHDTLPVREAVVFNEKRQSLKLEEIQKSLETISKYIPMFVETELSIIEYEYTQDINGLNK